MNDQSRCHDQDLGKRLRQGSLSHALHFCSKKGRAISPGAALGQKRTLCNVAPMSALPPTADIDDGKGRHSGGDWI
jgi:hypothetical protein